MIGVTGPDWIFEVLKQVPALCVLGYIVVQNNKSANEREVHFLDYMAKRDAEMMLHEEKSESAFAESIKHLGDACHLVQRDAVKVMKETTVELGRVREAISRILKKEHT